MQTITIELINDNALTLLKQLEKLNILRLLNSGEEKTVNPKPTWAGSISKETGKKMPHYVKESRQEWGLYWSAKCYDYFLSITIEPCVLHSNG